MEIPFQIPACKIRFLIANQLIANLLISGGETFFKYPPIDGIIYNYATKYFRTSCQYAFVINVRANRNLPITTWEQIFVNTVERI